MSVEAFYAQRYFCVHLQPFRFSFLRRRFAVGAGTEEDSTALMGRVLVALAALGPVFAASAVKPNIIVIVADDLGRNDLGARNAHAVSCPVGPAAPRPP